MPPTEADPPPISTTRRVAIGCFTTFLGMVSGGMIAVLVSKLVAYVTRAQACPDVPTCNWYIYWMVGAVIGMITLPILVLRVLGKPAQAANREPEN